MIISSSYSDLSCFAISVDQTVHPTDKIKKYLKSIIEHKHIFYAPQIKYLLRCYQL